MREPVENLAHVIAEHRDDRPCADEHAPAVPMNSSEASASGVFADASSGSVPIATNCTSTMIAVTATIVAMKANGKCRRGFVASPAGTPITS